MMKEKVPLTGLEPVLSALRGRRVNHLHHSGKLVALNGRFALLLLLTDSLNVRLSNVPLSLAIVSPKKAGFKSLNLCLGSPDATQSEGSPFCFVDLCADAIS